MKKRSFYIVAVVAALVTVVAIHSCKKEKTTIDVLEVFLNKSSIEICPDDTYPLEATIDPENATNKDVRWESTNDAVASVEKGQNGMAIVTAYSIGRASIRVITMDGDVRKTCTVDVVERKFPVTGVSISPKELTIDEIGGTAELRATITPGNATNKLMEFSTSNDKVAKVDADGIVTAIASGSATITVKTSDGGHTDKCEVTVHVPVTGVALKETAELLLGTIYYETILVATVSPATATNKKVKWSVNEAGKTIVSIEAAAEGSLTVKGLQEGQAIITATTEEGNFSRSCVVTVKEWVPEIIGGDFDKVVVYDHTFPKNRYPGFDVAVGLRYVSVDKDHLFISGRGFPKTATTGFETDVYEPHLLNFNDFRNGTITRINLNHTGVIRSGTNHYSFSAGQMAFGNMYVTNLTLGVENNPLYIYHWNKEYPDDPATVVAEIRRDNIPGAEGGWRLGDWINVDINNYGNGFIYLPRNANPEFLRLKVSNFTNLSEPTIFVPEGLDKDGKAAKITTTAGPFATFNKVDGVDNEYVFTGSASPVRLVNRDGKLLYEMTTFTSLRGCGAHIVKFNKARYLVTMNDVGTGGKSTIAIYDITRGETTAEALELFDTGSADAKAPVFLSAPLDTDFNAVDFNAAQIGLSFAKDGDNKLYVVGSASKTGFVLFEIPKLVE